MSMAAFGASTRLKIESGDDLALLHGLAATAALWFRLAGHDIRSRQGIGAMHCASHESPELGAVLAAALDLCDLLELSPQGRKAIADLAREPLLQESKRE